MRVVSADRDALVVTSRMWQTNAVALRAGGEAMLIDSPYFPDELEALPGVLAQAGFAIDALLATHADFDHLLGRLAFPSLSLGLAESTVERLRLEPGAVQRELRDQDAEFYVQRAAPLALGQVQGLPAPGAIDLGSEHEIELHPVEGHTADGVAFFARWIGVLVVGDYLSDVEIPMVASVEEYRSTLDRLAPLVEAATTIVPGHGAVHDRETALALLAEDIAYVEALERLEERPPLPAGRDGAAQRRIHAANLERVAPPI
jgi:glyoxylase-like metal-dependent hydrolase (beta-lactamase superfamily II)